MNDKIKELKDLLFELDSKHSVSVPDTQQNINDVAQKIVKLFAIPVVVHSKNKPKRVLGDFDVWYKPCTRCGYDTGKSTKPKDGNKTCWKCGNFLQRDYTDRALK